MIDLMTGSLTILRENGLATRLMQLGNNTVASFEDDSILGFVYMFETPYELISGWKEAEQGFLSVALYLNRGFNADRAISDP
jgi:hypothetical protein